MNERSHALLGSKARRAASARGLAVAMAALVAWAAHAAEPKALVLVRAGELSEEEISPRSRGDAPNAWRLAVSGASLVHIDFPSSPPNGAAEALRDALLPPELQSRLGERGVRTALARIRDAAGLSDLLAALETADSKDACPIERLERLFGKPPHPGEAERRAIEELRRALRRGERGEESGSDIFGPAVDLEALAASRLAFLAVRAASASREEVAARDRLLGKILEKMEGGSWLAVVNWRTRGIGSIFVTGPEAARGRVLARERSSRALAAIVARIFGIDASEIQDEIRREDTGEAFR